eukprot:CAMPEP_0113938162 /NCGR_PEP_ID=MMETSP1339-20121228/4569_1 /TAXON_ID=94617 /ORGANISM="Fibrocapsa japonica" /LENGTH=141 /DNA_ID=CAMNT_0000941135 /DNA_START=122 /DNA_END=547 /DNA_ORIENTATION=- /assembly_acc=CAM_ASM_000762
MFGSIPAPGSALNHCRARSIILLVKESQLEDTIQFYNDGLGLEFKHENDEFAEFDTGGTRLVIKGVEDEASCTTGFSPMLCFDVDDMDATIQRMLGMGARLDGPIQYPVHGKVASVRTPEGHMIGLFETNAPKQKDQTQKK